MKSALARSLVTLGAVAGLVLAAPRSASAQAPSVDDLKRALDAQLQKLKPGGYATRTVLFEEVRPGTPNGGYYPFQVTATIHDYGTGYPKNHFYGATCVGKMDKWKFDVRRDDFGEWMVQGRMTVSDGVCKNNPSEGVASIPLAGIPGTRAPAKGAAGVATPPAAAGVAPNGNLYIGEYACYGTGGRLMAGMGFVLKAGGGYQDLDGQRKGTYVYDAAASTLTFKGGFLGGQTGKNVRATGFALSSTVNCEPWR